MVGEEGGRGSPLPTRGEALLDLVLTNKEELIKVAKTEADWTAVTMPWLSL